MYASSELKCTFLIIPNKRCKSFVNTNVLMLRKTETNLQEEKLAQKYIKINNKKLLFILFIYLNYLTSWVLFTTSHGFSTN